MDRLLKTGALVMFGLLFSSCAASVRRPLVDPFPLRFPLTEVGRLEIDGQIIGRPWARDGILYYRTKGGSSTSVVVSSQALLGRSSPGPSAPEPSVTTDEPMSFRLDDGLLQAVDGQGRRLWEFRTGGAVLADPVRSGRRIYFGDSDRMFYCLDAATGKAKWRRRLQGAPLHPAVVRGGTVAVAASNSVVYRLSRRGGSILSWEPVPSRIVYELAAAGPLVLVSSASPTITALDLRTGKRAGQYEAPGPLAAGAVWSPPYVIVFVGDEESGRQKIVFLRSR